VSKMPLIFSNKFSTVSIHDARSKLMSWSRRAFTVWCGRPMDRRAHVVIDRVIAIVVHKKNTHMEDMRNTAQVKYLNLKKKANEKGMCIMMVHAIVCLLSYAVKIDAIVCLLTFILSRSTLPLLSRKRSLGSRLRGTS